VGKAQQAGAKLITGKMWRHGEIWFVGVAPPW
jgi:hypothetical protein